jgi:hypothetical protein
MSDTELEQRVTALTLALAKLLDGVSDEIIGRVTDRYPDILLAELRKLVVRAKAA